MLGQASLERGDKVEHRWRLHMHMDGCHWYSSVYVCAHCGATIGTYDERDPSADPYSLIWMEPSYDEDGNLVECKRCAELSAGAAAVHNFEYTPA